MRFPATWAYAVVALGVANAPAVALSETQSEHSIVPENRESIIPMRGLTYAQVEVIRSADAFFAALSSEDRSELVTLMMPQGMVFVHDRFAGRQSQMRIFSVEDFLVTHANRPVDVHEVMQFDAVLVDGDMAQVWGPYSFSVEGKVTHCGINSMSMVKQGKIWKVGNISFSMVPPKECEALGVSWLDDL